MRRRRAPTPLYFVIIGLRCGGAAGAGGAGDIESMTVPCHAVLVRPENLGPHPSSSRVGHSQATRGAACATKGWLAPLERGAHV
jgi:hypothetical protein